MTPNFNLYYLFIIIFLFLFSLIIQFIYNTILKFNYKYFSISIANNSVAFAKNYLLKKSEKIKFLPAKKNYFFSEINNTKKIIKIEKKAFDSTSIFYHVDTFFKVILSLNFTKYKINFKLNEIIFKILSLIFFWNIILSIIFSLWFYLIIFLFLFFVLIVLDFIFHQKIIKLSLKETKKFLFKNILLNEQKEIEKYLKHNVWFIFFKYFFIFSYPFTSFFQIIFSIKKIKNKK